LIEGILGAYCALDSYELWPSTLLDNTLNQFHYFAWSGNLENQGLVQLILDDLRNLLVHMEAMALAGTKYPMNSEAKDNAPETFHLYFNEIYHTNNTILLENTHSEESTVFLTHDSPNYIKSTDAQFYKQTFIWFQEMMEMSARISKDNRKERRRYFDILQGKLRNIGEDLRAIRRLR